MKDPSHRGGHTAEVLTLCDAAAFAPWLALPAAERAEDHLAFKAGSEWVDGRSRRQAAAAAAAGRAGASADWRVVQDPAMVAPAPLTL